MRLSFLKPAPALIVLGALVAPTAAPTAEQSRPPVTALGALTQLRGPGGCLVDRSSPRRGCKRVRALAGPAPFLGSNAVAISADGRHVYVASLRSDAIAVLKRNARTGKLTQGSGTAGCVAARGANGCGEARGLAGPNSVAVSADGKNVYATSRGTSAVAVFRRNRSTGALTQPRGARGCIADAAIGGCATGRALEGPDVVVVSPDGGNVYVGAFIENAIAVFDRSASTGLLTQPSDATGCVGPDGCAPGLGLGGPEGMAISPDGDSVYVASAVSNAVGVFARNSTTGALSQATDGSGCIADSVLAGCTVGMQLSGANAVAVSHDGDSVYVTSLLSNSLTTFDRTPSTGRLVQKSGTSACVVHLLAVGCSLGRALESPEGLAISPDGASVYAAAFRSGALDVFDRNTGSGAVMQKPRRAGCVTSGPMPDCTPGRALRGAGSIAVSPDGRYVYAAAFRSDAVSIFKRRPRGKG